MQKYNLLNKNQLNKKLNWACKKGHIKIIKYLLEILGMNISYDFFLILSESGNLEIIKYLINGDIKFKDIHRDNFWIFRRSCAKGYLDIVKYLLTSSELKDHATISEYCFTSACEYGHIEVVKYLLETKESKNIPTVNIHTNKDKGFIFAHKNGKVDIINYLIFNKDVFITQEIDNYLNGKNDLKKKFQAREMFKRLNKILAIKTSNKIVRKI